MDKYFVYIISNSNNTTLYTGVTNDIVRRIYEHKNKLIDGFSKEYNITKLIYYEIYDDIETAINREKKIKKWKREWKDELIDKTNINRNDLYYEILE
ncbi:MAG: GIY-YIG nuclease family protein [Candidatus Gracilibacteria bacterium]|nr:GIY-YIG nuclease family protein [Candidatus Gracilibacteria bacterium]